MTTTWGLERLGTPELGHQHNLRPSRQGRENPAALTPAQDLPSAARVTWN